MCDKVINLFTIKNPKHVERLLLKGFSPNDLDSKGRSPLFYNGSLEKTILLIEYKADVNLRDYKGRTALFYKYNDHESFKYIVDSKADINVKDNDGYELLDIIQDLKNVEKILTEKFSTNL